MNKRCRSVASLGLLVALLAPSAAQAQLSQYNWPIEQAILESHVDLQFQYSKLELGIADINVALLSLEGQIALGSVELAINVPFMVHGWNTSPNEVAFGDIMAGIKWRLFGVADNFGVAVFANAYLPTHSSDFTRSYTQVQAGAVASAQVMGFRVGGGLQTVWTILGDDLDDVGLLGFYAYARVPVLGLISLNLAAEYFNSLHPSGELNALLVTPAVELSVLWFHAGIGARIAVTDDAKALALGRAALIANAGARF